MKLTRSIATPPGWDASPSHVAFCQVTANISPVPIDTPGYVDRGTVRVKCLA